MADESDSNDAVNAWDCFDDPLKTWPLNPGFALLDEDHDQTFTTSYDPQLFGWNSQHAENLSHGFGLFDNSLALPEGSITPDLLTRSNTPGSDSSRHISSPSPMNSAVYTHGATYRSRLPRRRSLYSRQGPVIRQTSSPQVAGSPAWSPGLAQTFGNHDTSNNHFPTQGGPLRRSDSSTSIGSECSNSSAYSTASASSATSAGRRSSSSQRRHKRKANASISSKKKSTDDRPFKCTFCCDAFKSKYDWRRHEKSLHLDLEVWKCSPDSGTLPNEDGLGKFCAYCAASDPDILHLETHNHQACVSRSMAARNFRRRDHLAQHLRVFHKLHEIPRIDDWIDKGPTVASRCGFCNSALATWEERTDHLAVHFRQGCTMRDWQGGHGFDESIEARLTNALPPYLLATESRSLVPFSATSAETKDHLAQISASAAGAYVDEAGTASPAEPNQVIASISATDAVHTPALLDSRARSAEAFVDILASHLARFAHEYKQMGLSVTDEILQREARQVLYSSDDPWNQTVADSPVWLKDFRERHGLE